MSSDLATRDREGARLPERTSSARSCGTGRRLSRRGGRWGRPKGYRAQQAHDRGPLIDMARPAGCQAGMPGNLDAA